MMRGIFSFVLVFYALVVLGQDSGIPLSIRVPTSSRLILHAYAKGVQVYVCAQDPKDSSNYIWTFKEPRANLYGDSSYQQLVGQH
jgi:hypothetical protein